MYNLPSSVRTLLIDFGQVNSVINIPANVERLIFWDNKTNLLPIIPNTLIELKICDNKFTSIDKLPDSLEIFDCSENDFRELPDLPSKLVTLRCAKNHLQTLPKLPATLVTLDCSFNELKELKNFPNSLESIICDANHITNIKELPKEIREINLIDNPIKRLPKMSNNCQLRVSPTFLIKQDDYRHLLFDYKSKCPSKLENIINTIYKSFVDYDFDSFVSASININDFSWLSPLLAGDSISKMKVLKELITEDIDNQEKKDDFLTIANDIDNGLLLLDSVEVVEVDSTDMAPYKTYKTKFYFKSVGYDTPHKYLSIDIINSPSGYKWISFFSNLRDVKFNRNSFQKMQLPDKIPDDFEITIDYGHNYRFNSEQGVYLKRATCHRAIAKVNLTLGEKEKIFSILRDMNFNEFEEDMVKIRDSHFPPTSISIKYNGLRKTVIYNCLNDCDTNEYKKLREFMETINQILNKKKKVKKLPKTVFIYI